MRQARIRPSPELPPASWTYFLLVGKTAPVRLENWPEPLGLFGAPTPHEVWERHPDALLALAAQHGFEPHYVTKRRPKGESFEKWRARFLHEHLY